MPRKTEDPTRFKPEDWELDVVQSLLKNETGYKPTDGAKIIRYMYYSFRVPKGSYYISAYSVHKAEHRQTGKKTYIAALFRRVQKDRNSKPEWKFVKVSSRVIRRKCSDLARKWMCQKTGKEFRPAYKKTMNISEDRRAELANRMLDCAGRMHDLPVFDLDFKCSACDHEWSEVTYESGTVVCPECSFSQTY